MVAFAAFLTFWYHRDVPFSCIPLVFLSIFISSRRFSPLLRLHDNTTAHEKKKKSFPVMRVGEKTGAGGGDLIKQPLAAFGLIYPEHLVPKMDM